MPDNYVVRNMIKVVRCNASGGIAVPAHTCSGTTSIKRCPYFAGFGEGESLRCSYKPGQPRKYIGKDGDKGRDNARFWTKDDPIIALQVTDKEELPYEWRKSPNITKS